MGRANLPTYHVIGFPHKHTNTVAHARKSIHTNSQMITAHNIAIAANANAGIVKVTNDQATNGAALTARIKRQTSNLAPRARIAAIQDNQQIGRVAASGAACPRLRFAINDDRYGNGG